MEISFLESCLSGFREIDVYIRPGWRVGTGYEELAVAVAAAFALVAVVAAAVALEWHESSAFLKENHAILTVYHPLQLNYCDMEVPNFSFRSRVCEFINSF